jgi:hypothetical protein
MLHDSVEEVAAQPEVVHRRYRGNAPVLVLCDATRAFDSETLLSTISQRRRATMMGITSY